MSAHEKLAEWIAKSGYKKGHICHLIGCGPQRMSAWLTGDVKPTFNYALKIQEITGIAASEWG